MGDAQRRVGVGGMMSVDTALGFSPEKCLPFSPSAGWGPPHIRLTSWHEGHTMGGRVSYWLEGRRKRCKGAACMELYAPTSTLHSTFRGDSKLSGGWLWPTTCGDGAPCTIPQWGVLALKTACSMLVRATTAPSTTWMAPLMTQGQGEAGTRGSHIMACPTAALSA